MNLHTQMRKIEARTSDEQEHKAAIIVYPGKGDQTMGKWHNSPHVNK